MNLTPMFKNALIFMLLAGNLLAGVIKPENAKEFRDILIVSGNRSSYYVLKKEALVYKVQGPQRLKIYSRAVLNKKSSKSTSYGFEVQINGEQPLKVNHKQKWSKGVKSRQHPNHYFSKSTVDYITIPAGVNELIIRPEKRADPVMLRVLEDDSAARGKKKRVEALSEEVPVTLRSGGKDLSYYALKDGHTLFVTLEGPTNLEVITRLGFDPQMGRTEDYRIQVLDNGKLLGTYYFMSERSDESTVIGQNDVVPGKWRSCDIALGKGMHEVKLRLLDDKRTVFLKLNQIKSK